MAEICDQNFDVLCRLCLNHIDGDFVPIFDNDPIYHAATVKDKIFFITAILVSPEDRLPGQICGMCDDRVNDCYTFKQQSTVNNLKLLTYLQQQDDACVATKPPPVVGSPVRTNKRFHSSDSEQLQLGNAGQHPRNPNSPPLPNGNHAATGPAAVVSPSRKRKRSEVAAEDERHEGVRSPSKETSEGKATKREPEATSQEGAALDCEGKDRAEGDGDERAPADPGAKTKKNRVLWTMRTRGKAQKRFLAMGHRLRPSRHEESEAAADDDIFRYLRLNDVSRAASLKLASEANEALRAAEIAPVAKERKCPECGERFSTLPDLRDHRKATGHTMPKCDVCGKTFLTREVRDNHTLKKHRRGAERPQQQAKKKKERRCHECGVVFESLPDLRSHQNEAGHRLAPVCKICGIIYKSFEAREKHVLKRHKGHADSTGKIRFLCNVCNKNFKTKAHLASHLNQHAKASAGVRKYACELCDERFFDTVELRVHFEARHDSDTQLFQCLFCDATLSSSKALRSHFNRVHKPDGRGGELKYTCATCLQAFGAKAALNAHIRTHKMERLELDPLRLHKLFECEVCGESFKHNSAKKSHVLKCHTNEDEDDGKVKPVRKVQAGLPVNKKKIKRHSYAGVPDF